METTWAKISANLKKTLDAGLFKVWVAPLRADVSNGEMRILAPNDFMAAWVERHLPDSLREAAAPILGIAPKDIDIKVDVASVTERSPRPVADVVGRILPRPQASLPIRQPALKPVEQWRYTFDDFVTGPSNRMAFAAARDISQGGEVHTLFVNADPGLGKTHLVQAAGAALSGISSAQKVAYLTAEEFASRFVRAVKSRELEALKYNLCELDVLLLEDIHFLQRKRPCRR